MQCKTNTLTENKGTLRYQTWKESEYSPLKLSGKPFFQVTKQKVRQLTSSTSLSSIYPSVSCLYELSFCLALSARLAHTSFSPTFTHPFTSLSAFLLLLLPTSNFLAFSSSRVFLISTNHCRLLSLSLSPCVYLTLSVQLSSRPFLSCSLTVGKQLIMESWGGGWPYGESRASLIKVTLSAKREGWYGQRGRGGGSRGRKMGGGVQLWVNCMRAPISIRSQLLSDGKKHQYLHLLLTNSHDWAL